MTFFLRTGRPVTALVCDVSRGKKRAVTFTRPCLRKTFHLEGVEKTIVSLSPPLVPCVSLYVHHTKAVSRKCSLPPPIHSNYALIGRFRGGGRGV